MTFIEQHFLHLLSFVPFILVSNSAISPLPATNSFAISQSGPCTHARTVNKLQRLAGDYCCDCTVSNIQSLTSEQLTAVIVYCQHLGNIQSWLAASSYENGIQFSQKEGRTGPNLI